MQEFIRKHRKAVAILLIISAAVSIAFAIVDAKLKPAVLSISEVIVRREATDAMKSAGDALAGDITYEDLVKVVQDSSGNITMIQANTAKMNQLAFDIAHLAQENIAEMGNQDISIPLGTAIGGQLLSGKGPIINVEVMPVGSVAFQFNNVFEESGINQTRHSISLQLKASISIVMAGSSREIDVTTEIPISETVIVGKVPDSYLNWNAKNEQGSGSSEGTLHIWPPSQE